MAKNLFGKPVFEDDKSGQPVVTDEDRKDPALAGLTDEQIIGAKTPASGNMFEKPAFEPEEPPVAAPPEEPSFLSKAAGVAKDAGYAAAQGLGSSFNKLEGSVGTVAGALPVLFDKFRSLGGVEHTEAQDAWFKTFVDPTIAAQTDLEIGADAPFHEKAAHAAGSMLGTISQLVLTGGEGAAAAPVNATAGQVVRGAVEHGTKAMLVPAVSDAVDTGRKVYEATGDGAKATTAAQMQYLTSTLGGIVPLAKAGGAATRVATGAASGVVTGETSRELMNTVLPDQMQQAADKTDVALNALAGGMLGGVMGPRGEPVAAARKGPLDAIEEAGKQAAEAEGGDLMDQALAASGAHAEATTHHAQAFYEHSNQIERVRMADEAAAQQRAEAEEAEAQRVAQQQAILEASGRLDDTAGSKAPRTADEPVTPVPTAKDLAFEQAEADRGAAKETDFTKAQEQLRDQRIQQAALESQPDIQRDTATPPTLADVAPPELLDRLKPVTERRLERPEPVNLFEKAVHEPEPPKTLAERRALPAPKTARFEVSKEGVARPVTEGELASRQKPENGLLIRREAAQKQYVPAREIDRAAHEAATSPRNDLAEPTAAQKEAGNYKMGHVEIHGLDVSIENPKGSMRTYTDERGEKGQRRMRDHYGYVRGSEGADGDHVDAFIGEYPESDRVFVIDQLKATGGFDEHKAMIGYRDEGEAVRAYKRNFQSGWKVGPVSEMNAAEFKKWVHEGDTKSPLRPNDIAMPARAEDVETARTLAERRGKPSKLRFAEAIRPSRLMERRIEKLRAERDRVAQQPWSPERNARVHELNKQIQPLDDALRTQRGRENGLKFREGDLTHTAGEGGQKIALEGKTGEDAGFLMARNRGDRVQVTESHIEEDMRGKGHGVRMYEQLVQKAHAQGKPLVSDTSVSEHAEKMYDALERRGYDVRRNPNVSREVVGGHGVKVLHSEDTRPVFEVHPKKEPVKLREGAGRDNAESTDVLTARHVEIQKAIEPLAREMPRLEPKVLRNHTEAPAGVRAEIEHLGQEDARGVYDPESDTVYIFSDNHDSPEEAVRTAIHEGVAHKGLRHLLGTDFADVMSDVFKNAKDREWVKDFLAQHNLRDDDPEHRITAAEEYAASLAERMERDPSVFRKVVDKVRSALRKLGLVRAWTDDDIRALLRKARTSLSERSSHAVDRYGHLRFADKGYEKQAERLPDDHPLNVFLKQGATVEEQANYNPGFVRSRLDALKDFGENNIETLLGAIPRRNLPDFVPKMPSAAKYVREAARMDGRRNELLVKADKIANRWVKYVGQNKDGARTLGELMHAATLAGVEPANEYRPKYSEPRDGEQQATERLRKQQWLALRKHWNSMDGEAKALYVDVRDSYAADRDLVMKGLADRIEATDADGKTKQSLLAELRRKFEAGRVEGPYFPLGRYGKHWAVAKDADGQVVSFTRFEKPSEQRQWLAEMEKAGFKVDGGVQMQDREMARRIDPNFVAKITDLLQQIDPELADEVWQNYLRAMPEMSMRKHFIHRKGRLGFTMDAIRNFGYQKFHGAHQIAKLEHMHALESLLDQMKVEAVEQNRTPEEKWSAAVAKEFDKRHEWMRNPKASGVATALTSLGFMYYLGATPAAALVNLSQNAMVAFPTIASKFNWTGAGIEMTRAAAQFAGSRGQLANRLRGDERLAFDEGKRIGLFDKTMAHDLAQIGEEGMDYGSVRNKMMNIVSWMFHHAEEFNRQTTFLASYRLARRKGTSHDEAINQAEDIVWDSHFDYSNTNRARYLQSDAAKVLLLFRQYSANMTYRLARDFNDGLRGATPAQRSEARQRFTGMLGATMIFAGASGMPLWWLASGIINTIFADKDKPYDAEAEMRAYVSKHYGEGVSSSIMDGPVSAMSGAAINGRVGLNNMWVQDAPPGMEGRELGLFYLGQAAGPLGGLVVRGFDAAQPAPDGFGQRALEKVIPKAAGDVLKSIRYAREGVTTQRGDIVVPAAEMSKRDIFLQAMGFTPYKASLQYEKNRTIGEYSQQIMQRKALLKNKLYLAAHNDDPQGVKDTMQEIGAFNKANPTVGIKAEDLVSSAKARAKYTAESINGLHVEPGLRYLYKHFDSTKEAPREP